MRIFIRTDGAAETIQIQYNRFKAIQIQYDKNKGKKNMPKQ